jgi:hypothetical protein
VRRARRSARDSTTAEGSSTLLDDAPPDELTAVRARDDTAWSVATHLTVKSVTTMPSERMSAPAVPTAAGDAPNEAAGAGGDAAPANEVGVAKSDKEASAPAAGHPDAGDGVATAPRDGLGAGDRASPQDT